MKEILPGQKANIKYYISDIRSGEVRCDILSVESDRLVLKFPQDKMNEATYLHEGKEIEVYIYTDKGIHVLDSIVIDSPLEQDFVIEFFEDTDIVQRREYLRVPVVLDLELFKGSKTVKTKTINISGGGIRFKANIDFTVGDLWRFALKLPNSKNPVHGEGEILYLVNNNENNFSVIKFTDIIESERNRIIKFCFEEDSMKYRRF